MKNTIISFIGGGNMASSLIGGLLHTGVPADHLRVVDPNPEPVAARYPVRRFADYQPALQEAGVVVLAVKPQIMHEVAAGLSQLIPEPSPLFISVAAGIRVNDLARWLGREAIPLVRVMPNTPALVQSGASALFAGAGVGEEQKDLAESILRAVGLTLWVDDEELLNAVTALSGSGPAYCFLIMEVMQKAAMNLGLPAEQARLLTLQTAFGAAKMALESSEDAEVLRNRVTSKGGTTEQAIQVLQENGIQEIFDKALEAACQRSIALAGQLGES